MSSSLQINGVQTSNPNPPTKKPQSLEATTPTPTPPFSPDDLAADMPSWRRWFTLYVVCWMSLPLTFMSTSIMTVTPEIASSLGTKPTSITLANAGVFVAMAMSALIWLPLSKILGRRTAYLVAAGVLVVCSVGCALARSMTWLTAVWVVSGTTGPFFLVAGQTVLSDIFEPTTRGTAVGIFLGSSVSAQSITPMLGSIIATYSSWRFIFAVQGAISLYGLILAYFFVPRTSELSHLAASHKPRTPLHLLAPREITHAFNPMAVFRQWRYPSIVLNNLACSLLSVNQYGLLSSVRHVINPLFAFSLPMYSGLFFLVPGAGFLLGSLAGGRISDKFVKWYMVKRNGVRLPEDRLNGSLLWAIGVLPMATMIYGFSLDKGFGGKGVPIAFAFIEGFGLMASFSGLNTYAAEVHPEQKTAVISGKYVFQYIGGAAAVGGVIPMIDAIGPGLAFTMTGSCAFLAGIFMITICRCLVRKGVGKPRTSLFHPH